MFNFFKSAIISLWLYNYKNEIGHTVDTYDVIYLCIFTHAHAGSFCNFFKFFKIFKGFFKFLWSLTLLFDIKKISSFGQK